MLPATASRSSLPIALMSAASDPISCATTLNADPAAPARAASIRALSASTLVRRVTSSISATFSSVTRDTS